VNRTLVTSGWLCGTLLMCVFLFTGCGDRAGDDVQAPSAAQQPAQPGAATKASASAPVPDVDRAPELLSDELLADGWLALFDGQTLFGWQPTTEADWRVQDSAIVVSAGAPGLLVTTTEFSNYQLHLEFRAAEGTNSGVFLATGLKPTDPAADCYEVNIAGADNPFPTGSLVGRQAAKEPVSGSDWKTCEIRVDAGHVVVEIDGRQLVDYTDPAPLRRGPIGLQLNAGPVAFRNIRLRPLGLESLFNGRDLTEWKADPASPAQFTVTDQGALNVQNGRGQLESERQFADFVLQLECISHAPELNSGVFFRCIPGEEMNGYESQIHNGFKQGDRTQPVDCGTGGIFRRVNARRVVADDLKWFYKTIVADGPHVSVWVNGYQVTDWTDKRPPDPNPRKGLRLEPGTIMIQAHDPTTNLSFRNLRATEL